MLQKFTKSLGLIVLAGWAGLSDAQGPNFKWSAAGPVYTAGRVRNMVVDHTDPSRQRFYAGSTSSGVFFTTNGGASWSALNDQGSVKNISYMAQAPDATGTIYAATGEGFLRLGQKAKALPGTGLYKLNGNSLTLVADSAITGRVINRIAISPVNSSIIALATNKGVLISQDGGANFSTANFPLTHTMSVGQDVEFDGNGVLYCTYGSENGSGATLVPTATKVYKSTDLNNFTPITPTSSALADLNYGRVELAIAPSNNNIIYASCANKNPTGNSVAASTLKAFYVSYDAGATWALIIQGSSQLDPLSNGGTLASGDYAHTIMVDANNPHRVFYGGFFMYVFERQVGAPGDSNTSPIGKWTQIGHPYALNSQIYLKENLHDVKVIPGNPTRFYFVTDAGIYRSTDMVSTSQPIPPSIQPFYKGLVTGQFNSVSIERFPTGTNNGNTYMPNTGFVGGTGANGMTYFSGTSDQVTQEVNYLSGDIYNSEFSKILPEAAFASRGTGEVYRSSNVKNSSPSILKVNKYDGSLSKIAPVPEDFVNNNITTGTPFKLWEWYGQTPANPDSMYFYNDSLRFQASVPTVPELIVATNFTWTAIRPNSKAMIDSIVVRTGTVNQPVSGSGANAPTFNTGTQITIKLNNNYANTNTLTVISGTDLAYTGSVNTSQQPTVTLNNVSLNDQINVTFSQPPFANKTQTSSTINHAGYYRVFATVFYKYKAGDQVTINDNNISTKPQSYTVSIPQDLKWVYTASALATYTINFTKNAALSNPTFVLLPNNVTSSVPSFTVKPLGVKSYTVRQYGDYIVTLKPVIYTLTATTDTNVPGTTYTYVLLPDNTTKTAASTATGVTFTVNPTAQTVYTITQTGTGTLTAETVYTVNPTNYLVNGANPQSSNVFTITTLPGDPTKTFTLSGVSSNTALGLSTSTTVTYPVQTVHNNIGAAGVPMAGGNPRVKVESIYSARFACALNNAAITGGNDAVVVSKNPLALNDPMSFVRISQSGARTDSANGNASTNTITVDGKPTVIEWSKSGMELYYATDANKVYRVSHITEVSDLSPSSYNGKFFTDVFRYNPTGNPNSFTLNPQSPYRTTLLGTFDRTITSISVSKDDASMVVTFNNPANTGTSGIVAYTTNDIRKSNESSIGWVNKTGQNNVLDGKTVYCSMMEKDDSKQVFLGTNAGIYYTSDINSGVWVNANNNLLPNVQIFDIEQQTLPPWDCYNSGQIYVATFGRGIWSNNEYLKNYTVGEEENYADMTEAEESRLNLFPNPASNEVNVSFTGVNGEKAVLQVMDLSGRMVKTSELDQISSGETTHKINTSDMNPGVYIINVSSDSGVKRVAKLIVSK